MMRLFALRAFSISVTASRAPSRLWAVSTDRRGSPTALRRQSTRHRRLCLVKTPTLRSLLPPWRLLDPARLRRKRNLLEQRSRSCPIACRDQIRTRRLVRCRLNRRLHLVWRRPRLDHQSPRTVPPRILRLHSSQLVRHRVLLPGPTAEVEEASLTPLTLQRKCQASCPGNRSPCSTPTNRSPRPIRPSLRRGPERRRRRRASLPPPTPLQMANARGRRAADSCRRRITDSKTRTTTSSSTVGVRSRTTTEARAVPQRRLLVLPKLSWLLAP